MDLILENRLSSFLLNRRTLQSCLDAMARALKLADDQVLSLVLCSVRAIVGLGETHFGQGYPTDVIAFPTGFEGMGGMLGEIWIAPDTVARNGLRYGKGLNGEFLFVLAHGVLHLLGEEDDTPQRKQAMFKRQEKLLRACQPQGQLPRVLCRRGSRGRGRQ